MILLCLDCDIAFQSRTSARRLFSMRHLTASGALVSVFDRGISSAHLNPRSSYAPASCL